MHYVTRILPSVALIFFSMTFTYSFEKKLRSSVPVCVDVCCLEVALGLAVHISSFGLSIMRQKFLNVIFPICLVFGVPPNKIGGEPLR